LGELKWRGKQGRLEIVYDDVDEVWRGFMSVEVEEPPIRGGDKPLHIDLGVVNLATIWCEGMRQPISFSGRAALADWWYWTEKIAKEQRRLAGTNSARTSRKLRKLYRMRQRRFRHTVNAMVKWIVEYASGEGISKIILGNLRGIRGNHGGSKTNSMVNNFWSHGWIIRRLKEKAEEYGIIVEEIDEHGTSSECPFCGARGVRRHRGMFYCPKCEKVMNADVVGVLNIAKRYGSIIPSPSWRDRDNGVVADPLLLRWDGCRWEPRRAVNTEEMNTVEARIPLLKQGECQTCGGTVVFRLLRTQ